ncbi:MAG: glycosyltransferase family 2 protein [Anaerolineae bacterium]
MKANEFWPRVAVIVLNWNGLEDTLECLESLRRLDYPNYEVILVDNGSADGSPEVIRKHFPEVKIIENRANLGFVAGNNVGMAFALMDGADCIFLLNNDTHVDENCLRELARAAKSSPEIGIVGPLMHRIFQPEITDMGGDFNFWTGSVRLRRFNRKGEKLQPIDYVWGCGFFVKAEVLREIGLFDPCYVAYFEDADFCMRARARGYRTVVATNAQMWHKIGRSGEKRFLWQTYMRLRNHFHFFLSHARPYHYLTLIPALLFYQMPMFLIRSLRLYLARKLMPKYRDRPISLWYREQTRISFTDFTDLSGYLGG